MMDMDAEKILCSLRDEILRQCLPEEILVFSQKVSPCGELTSVKLCVIVGNGDGDELESRLYLGVESDIQFDVLVYSREEWDGLVADEDSFATRISQTGRAIYASDKA